MVCDVMIDKKDEGEGASFKNERLWRDVFLYKIQGVKPAYTDLHVFI